MTHPGNYAVCVIGLGAMGMGAARSCLRAGLTTYGADLNPQALAALQQAGAKQTAPSARDFAAELDAVLLLVVNAAQVKQILFGEQGLAPQLKPGTAVMVSSTISADDAKQIEQRLLDYGLAMLDAPVSGGAAKAEEGQMTVMAAGADATFAPATRAGRHRRQGLPHRRNHRPGRDGKNHPPAVGRGAHRRRGGSHGAGRPRQHPAGRHV